MAIREQSGTLLSAFSPLLYCSKIFGIVIYSLTKFSRYKKLMSSNFGILWAILSLILHFAQYHFMSVALTLNNQRETTRQSALTKAIGLCLNYTPPLMMSIDIITGLTNHQRINLIFKRFESIDEHLKNHGIYITNTKVKFRVSILITTTVCCEFVIAALNFTAFYNPQEYKSWLSFALSIPFVINGIEKIWFSSLMFALRQRFEAMNQFIDGIVFDQLKRNSNNYFINSKNFAMSFKNDENNEHINIYTGYLQKEIMIKKSSFKVKSANVKTHAGVIPVLPWRDWEIKEEDEELKNSNNNGNGKSDLKNMNITLNGICHIHDELCEVGKTINMMWNLQLLLLMAFGFINMTAQFYFLYCNIVGQDVPNLFRSATSLPIVCFSVAYVAGKNIYIIYLSWQTKLEAHRTGISLHKSGLAFDQNDIYEIVNHLSLKLLTHAVRFTACGFFNLDMTTLYATTGAITSYMIILIQFNLATHQARKSTEEITMMTPAIRSSTTFEMQN